MVEQRVQRAAAILAVIALVAAARPARAHPSAGVVIDSRGNVYYSDLERVWRLAPDGTKTVVVSGVHTHELMVDAADNLYGEHVWYEGERSDKWGHYVWRRAPSGRLDRVVPAREGFRSAWSFVRDARDNGYFAVSDENGPDEIRRRDTRGTISTLLRQELGIVRWMAVSPAGTLFFTGFRNNQHDLYRLTAGGALVRLAHDLAPHGPLDLVDPPRHATFGLWPDRQGGAYVTISAARQVVRVSSAGRVNVVARSPFPWAPTGGVLAADGTLWILEGGEPGHCRLRRIGRDGRERVFD